MKERLLKFLNAIHLSSSRFAEEIGIQPSGVSHILSGRNNPGYDFIVKILRKYPDLNPDWLLLGEGEMFRNKAQTTDLFDDTNQIDNISENVTNVKSENPVSYLKSKDVISHDLKKTGKQIDKIILLQSDGSFKEYFPG
jgi:transcriptional regulator with XRE-family HTH domain